MDTETKIQWKPLLISLAISIGIGTLSGVLNSNSGEVYSSLVLPPLAPPSIVFPIVWTTLFALMGISAYLVYISGSPLTKSALTLYGIQLAINFLWQFIFFGKQAFLLAFIWLILLLLTVIAMTATFYRINKTSGYLQLPYIAWTIFAGYLSLGVYLLN